MAQDRRRELIATGIDLVREQRFADLLASVDTRSITDRAGVTTGSFFHHFRNRAQFAEAVAERFRELWDVSVDQVVSDIVAFVGGGDTGGVRSVAQADWDKLEAADAEATLLHLLWASRAQPLGVTDGPTAGDALRDAYASLLHKTLPAYRRALTAMGRQPMAPFDEVDLAVTMTALADGIQMRQAVQPEVVRSDLFADLVAGAMISLTRPIGEQGDPVDLFALEADLAVPVRTDRQTVAGQGETWRQIADAAAPLFDGQRIGDVKVADIAVAAGVSTSTVYHHFTSVAEVAACGWVRFLPELEAIATTPIRAGEGPIMRLEQVLTRIVEIGKVHPGALEGLMIESVASAGDASAPDGRRLIGAVVPLAPLLAPLLRELRARGRLRRRIDSATLARTMVHLVGMRLLAGPDDPVERIIDETAGLLLDGALTATDPMGA